MATKKQKREAGLKKHEAFMEEQRKSGLRAQASAQAARIHENLAAWQENHDKNHRGKQVIKECPHCQIHILEMKAALE